MMINWLSAICRYVDLVQSVGHSKRNPTPLFVESAQHRYFRIDNPIALALLTLIAAKQNKLDEIPAFMTHGGYIHGDYQINGKSQIVYDIDFIYPTLLSQ
ncbi:exopolygalacturonate lyase [Yersinia aldovae]|nr:exopolygalacturonate lyase [Yersinia aldovae]